jgi:protein Mpv17
MHVPIPIKDIRVYVPAPLLLPAAFFAWGCALIDHSGWPEFKRKMRVDFLPTLTAEVSIWPIVQSVNFSVVPLQHQLLVINVFTIMDAAFMSWARNQEDWVTKVLAVLPGGKSSSTSSSGTPQLEMRPLAVESSKRK